MFGIPTVGSNLCGSNFAKDEKNADDLCLRSFQLSIVSPLASYSNDAKDLSAHPYKMKT
jgi:alpha-glucosidase (family GH31 glycosyl hydrolase)